MKSKLVYRDEDELDTGMQKVQPLPFLGREEIGRELQRIVVNLISTVYYSNINVLRHHDVMVCR